MKLNESGGKSDCPIGFPDLAPKIDDRGTGTRDRSQAATDERAEVNVYYSHTPLMKICINPKLENHLLSPRLCLVK